MHKAEHGAIDERDEVAMLLCYIAIGNLYAAVQDHITEVFFPGSKAI